jgi:hypothetical protein
VEKRWPLLGTLALAMAVPLLLPSQFSLGPDWIVPAVIALLLVAIIVANRGRGAGLAAAVRPLLIALVVVLIVEAAGVTVRLVLDVI